MDLRRRRTSRGPLILASSLEILCSFCSKSFASLANFFRRSSLILKKCQHQQKFEQKRRIYAQPNLSINPPTPTLLRFQQLQPPLLQITQRKPFRGHIISQSIRLQFRLHIPEKRRQILPFRHPGTFRRLLVRCKFGRLGFGVDVCPVEDLR